jgi:uncharacterized membrane protein
MTDEQKTNDEVEAVAISVSDSAGGIQAAGIVAADSDHEVLVAEFADPTAAMVTYRNLPDAEIAGTIDVEGVLVVNADSQGNINVQKVTDHSTKTGVKWGVVGGVVLGVIFPPSIIGSAAVLGVGGGVLGKLRQEHHKSQLADSLYGALAPNTSGIIVLAKLPAVPAVKQTMPDAKKVTEVPVDAQTAADITAAAKEASAEPAAAPATA